MTKATPDSTDTRAAAEYVRRYVYVGITPQHSASAQTGARGRLRIGGREREEASQSRAREGETALSIYLA